MTYMLAVVGKNISYSKSPLIHSEFGKALEIEVRYTIQDVGKESFESYVIFLQKAGFQGCNITVPYKEAAFALATEKSERAKEAGAANTFIFNTDGSIFADNTDGIGFIQDVTRNIGFTLQGKRVLICGAGGAVRGILGPLIACKPKEIIIANRSQGKCLLGLSVCDYRDLVDQSFDVVIDGTSLKGEPLSLPESLQLNPHALVYDLKYSPEGETPIMRWAKAKGAQFIHDGIGMLVEQAAFAFELWTGKTPRTQPVLRTLKASYTK